MRSLVLALATFGVTMGLAAPAAAALPDLVIKDVVRSGSTARVLVHNQGMAPAKANALQLVVVKNNVTIAKGVTAVPVLNAGQQTWVSVTVPTSLTLKDGRQLHFMVDPGNVVGESNELNNRKLTIP